MRETISKIIRTDFIYPPIPIRQFDWVAWLDGCEEDGPYGYGQTEDAAIAELYAEMAIRDECR
jgi:hypothetical protein